MTDLAFDTRRLPRRLDPGQLLGSRYRLERVAGAGGMAIVWRAHDERLQRPVAIKVISDTLAANPAAIVRFAREARTHAKIQHPNLVQVYDYSTTGAYPYLVMEYVDGATLSERLDGGGFSASAVRRLAEELLSAIACVHDHGVLHRDIKCANVLLDGWGRARLTDFGLARLEESTRITRPDEVVGTLRFLAPELIEGKPASRQSDLFALGVVLRTAANHAAPQSQLSQLIRWLTQHDPQARPADAHAALDLLTEPPTAVHTVATSTLAGEPSPKPQSQPSRPVRRLRSRVFAVSALLVAFGGTGFTIATDGGNNRPSGAATMSPSRTAAKVTHGGQAPTIDQQLRRLASGVRAAARPRA